MAVEIEYDKRSIWRNIFDPGAWQNLLGGVGNIAGDVATAWEKIEKIEGSKPLVTEPPPYQPNLTLADFFHVDFNRKGSALPVGIAKSFLQKIYWGTAPAGYDIYT